jgi:hypothetical protein
LPENSTGGNGGFYVHTIRTLLQKDGRFKDVKITNVLGGIPPGNDPVKLMKFLAMTSQTNEKFLIAGNPYFLTL